MTPELMNRLEMWTIYRHPRDYPQGFVVRRCWVGQDGDVEHETSASYAGDLSSARRHVPEGMVCTARHPEDDPAIAEVWI